MPQVGYSYCGSGTGHGAAPKCKWDDHTQAVANYGALLSFFDSFPEQAPLPPHPCPPRLRITNRSLCDRFKDNEFFITGESYGGMYVPTLVEQIYNHSDSPVNLKGFAVGNGVIGHEDKYPGSEAVDVSFLHNSRFVSEELWNEIINACGPELTRPGLKCEQLKRRAEEGAGDCKRTILVVLPASGAFAPSILLKGRADRLHLQRVRYLRRGPGQGRGRQERRQALAPRKFSPLRRGCCEGA